MAYIPLEAHLPGITGLLEFRKDTAQPIRELTQILMRGPSTLTEGERELIATVVSHRNECTFCTAAHTAAADILLDENNEVQCVIDLDTVMPGYVAYDFGDAIRTIINTALEDEPNLDAIQLNVPLFTGFTRGYLGQTHSFLTEAELGSLMSGVLLMPYMQSIRFVTDYLEGDVYYKTSSIEHNLQRARAQMQLFKLLEDNKKGLTDIVNNEWLHLKNNLYPEGASFGK